MGLLTILKKMKQKEREVRILILGLDNAGKTTIVRTICHEPINEIQPTLGFTIQTYNYKNLYQINLWDVGGQKSIRAYWRNYFEQTDGIIWVIDSSDINRIELCRIELYHLLNEEKILGSTLLIYANKQDVDGAYSTEQITNLLGLQKESNDIETTTTSTEKKEDKEKQQQQQNQNHHHPLKNRHWKIVPCSAVTGKGISVGFDWIINDIAERMFSLN